MKIEMQQKMHYEQLCTGSLKNINNKLHKNLNRGLEKLGNLGQLAVLGKKELLFLFFIYFEMGKSTFN